MPLTLIIGNKNYASWSLRPWIAMRVAGIAFDEKVIPLYEPGSREQVLKYSPAGKVPVLIDGDEHVWESLAILEHLAEKFPGARLWPPDPGARSRARVAASEMHAGFTALRRACPMNMWLPPKPRPLRYGRSVFVRRLRRRRRHVCPGGRAAAQFWPRRRQTGARLYGRGDGPAGLGTMARRRAQRALDNAP
jgi:glutathione S-transferase